MCNGKDDCYFYVYSFYLFFIYYGWIDNDMYFQHQQYRYSPYFQANMIVIHYTIYEWLKLDFSSNLYNDVVSVNTGDTCMQNIICGLTSLHRYGFNTFLKF